MRPVTFTAWNDADGKKSDILNDLFDWEFGPKRKVVENLADHPILLSAPKQEL